MTTKPKNQWFGTDNLSTSGFLFFFRSIMLRALKKVKHGGHAYVFIDWRNYPIMTEAIESAGWRINGMLVWDKQVLGMGNAFRFQHELVVFCSKGVPKDGNVHNLGNVLRVKRLVNTDHPTQKPIPLIEMFLKMSTKEGDTVLDPFMGSGTTAVACQQSGRKFIGFELDKKYVVLAEKRLAQKSLAEAHQ